MSYTIQWFFNSFFYNDSKHLFSCYPRHGEVLPLYKWLEAAVPVLVFARERERKKKKNKPNPAGLALEISSAMKWLIGWVKAIFKSGSPFWYTLENSPCTAEILNCSALHPTETLQSAVSKPQHGQDWGWTAGGGAQALGLCDGGAQHWDPAEKEHRNPQGLEK